MKLNDIRHNSQIRNHFRSNITSYLVVVIYCRGRPRLVLVNCLEDLSLPRNSTTINLSARHDLVVDWAIKLQHKQTKKISAHELGDCNHNVSSFFAKDRGR